jgi:hypothetical protein
VVTVQRHSGLTPHQLRAKAVDELEALKNQQKKWENDDLTYCIIYQILSESFPHPTKLGE